METEITAGFYKLDNDSLLYAPNFVDSPTFLLTKETKDNFIYPMDGWYWFDDEDTAYNYFGVEKKEN